MPEPHAGDGGPWPVGSGSEWAPAEPSPSFLERPAALPLAALIGLVGAVMVGGVVVPWSTVYGSWAADGAEFAGLGVIAIALAVGGVLWLLACLVPSAATRWRLAAFGLAVLATWGTVNVLSFQLARSDTCRIQRANGADPRLHPVPWPLAVDCTGGAPTRTPTPTPG
ncbi:MAG TPA: hypothetical protein VI248_07445 [Kineosporiaceae bacterium]